MEIILDTYAEPWNPLVPVICFDESGKELQDHVRPPIVTSAATLEDPEYRRHGSANLVMFFAPLLGWRHVRVTTQRTAVDWALAMRELVDVHFPDAARILVVLDNLNTHRLSSLYLAFPPAEAHRIARRIELRFTPQHASWLTMAELEFSVLSRQCLNRRIRDQSTLQSDVIAWANDRNRQTITARWTFTTAHARTRLHHLYPIPPLPD